jgi:sortase A
VTDRPAAEQNDTPADEPTTDAPIRHRFGRVPRDQRISKWDRPPEPHDWRFYVGSVGKVLIATGLLMFGFVAYQLWGTGIETAIAQDRLEDRFDALLDGADAQTPPATTTPATDAPPADTIPSADSVPSTDAPVVTHGDVATVDRATPDLPDEGFDQSRIPQPASGEPLLRLEIPAIGRDDIVVPGVTMNDLQNGPGHYPDTPLPGQLGNAAIAGHRTTYGAPFFDVDQLRPGDEIITTLLNGDRFVYEVTSTEIVSASDYWVVTTRDPDIAELTLTSCHPKFTARERIVVHSVLNPDKSSNVGHDGAPATPIEGDDPVPNADIEITAPDSALGDVDASTNEATESPPDTTGTAADDEPDAAGAEPDDDQPRPAGDDEPAASGSTTADDGPADAFSQGWLDDRGALVQIAIWGLALTMIWLAARRVSRRYRRDSIGILVGIAPFAIALYFFYQNVNRLLPPGI